MYLFVDYAQNICLSMLENLLVPTTGKRFKGRVETRHPVNHIVILPFWGKG